jgi:hypothetical protein
MAAGRVDMKAFWLVMMLGGLVLTAWLVMRDMQEQKEGVSGPAVVAPLERAADVRKAQEAADLVKERRVTDASRE